VVAHNMGSAGARNTAALEWSGARNGAGSPNTTLEDGHGCGTGAGAGNRIGASDAKGVGVGFGRINGEGEGFVSRNVFRRAAHDCSGNGTMEGGGHG
jgi:hypothetical protein